MDKKRNTKEKKIRYFHEEQAKEEELLNIGLKESRRAKKERQEREIEKTESEKLQDELEPIDENI